MLLVSELLLFIADFIELIIPFCCSAGSLQMGTDKSKNGSYDDDLIIIIIIIIIITTDYIKNIKK